jgi:hypothetical protein
VLGALELVQDRDGVRDVLDPDLVDVDGVGADVVLNIGDFGYGQDDWGGFMS